MSRKLLHPSKMVKNQNGQTFLEFVMLMLVLVSLSFITLKGFNNSIAERWLAIVKVIANPSPTAIELP